MSGENFSPIKYASNHIWFEWYISFEFDIDMTNIDKF